MFRFLARGFAVLLVLVAILPGTVVAASPVGAPTPTGPTVAQLRQHYHDVGLDLVADRLLVRYDVPLKIDRPVTWPIVQGSSPNWSGYVADQAGSGNVANEVRGFFHVRQVFSSPAIGSWAGIGGFNGNGTLYQSGVDQLQMAAWTENTADGFARYWFTVSSGDFMFSNVFNNRNGSWTV